jgi:hypothetical protein
MTATASSNSMRLDSSSESVQVKFHNEAGQANVHARLNELLQSATTELKAAVCFVTQPGAIMLACHAERFRGADGFFVASVDPPTNLNALHSLHSQAPGRIYIHLGGSTPEEIDVGHALMHSKLFLSSSETTSRLWVGSHNLTGMAILGGNFEAALEVTAPCEHAVIREATRHLEACRAMAEPFDPDQMQRYREIQKRRSRPPNGIEKKPLLIIHAEAQIRPTTAPFTAHVHLAFSDFDRLLGVDGEVRLFLHPPGMIGYGKELDFSAAELWVGSITAVVRTERHPRNQGLSGRFDKADFDIILPDLATPPVLIPAGSSSIAPMTQAVLRMAGRAEVGDEVYSVGSNPPYCTTVDTKDIVFQMHEVNPHMLMFFTPQSHDGGHLLYRPIQGMKTEIRPSGYKETAKSALPEKWEHQDTAQMVRSAQFLIKEPNRPVEAFFYKSRYVIRSKK